MGVWLTEDEIRQSFVDLEFDESVLELRLVLRRSAGAAEMGGRFFGCHGASRGEAQAIVQQGWSSQKLMLMMLRLSRERSEGPRTYT
jgi:hypothetical protein